MYDDTHDFVFFDPEDIDLVLEKFGIYEQAATRLGKEQLDQADRDFLHSQAAQFLEAFRGNEINTLGGEAAGIAGKYHYKLNKAIPALLEFVVVEAAAIATIATVPVVGIPLTLGGPAIAVFGKWREVMTHLDQEEIIVLRTMTDLIKSDYRVLREEGVSEPQIRDALERSGLAVADLSACLERLCGDVGDKKVLIKTRGAGNVDRYTPIP